MQKKRPLKGFSLLELIVGLAIAAIVITAAMMIIIAGVQTEIEAEKRMELTLRLAKAGDTIARDLSYVGVGVPYGRRLQSDGSVVTGAITNLPRPPIRSGREHQFSFVGDLPYPNAQLNGIASLSAIRSGDHISIASELSPCGAPEDGQDNGCRTENASLLNVGGTRCTENNIGADSCPWGMGKFQPVGGSVDLIVGTLGGNFYERRWDTTTC